MIIIIEGPDCSGKTTLSLKLKDVYTNRGYKVHMFHSGWSKKSSAVNRHFGMLQEASKYHYQGNVVILDRHYPSEYAYQTYFDGIYAYDNDKELKNRFLASYFSSQLKNMNGQMILCLPPLDCVIDKFDKEFNEGNEHFQDITPLYHIYEEFFESTSWFDYLYDYSTNTIDNLVNFLDEE